MGLGVLGFVRGCGVWGLGGLGVGDWKVWQLGLGVLGFEVSRFVVLGFSISSLGFEVQGSRYRVQNSGFEVKGTLGFSV